MEEKVADIINKNSKKKTKRMQKNEHSLKRLWDVMKCTNILIIEVAEEESKRLKTYLKIMTEDFLNLVRGTFIQAQEAQRVPNRINPRKSNNKTNGKHHN